MQEIVDMTATQSNKAPVKAGRLCHGNGSGLRFGG